MTFPYDSMHPMVRQIHEAEDDRARALVLLCCPDVVLTKHRDIFETACRRAGFDIGVRFIEWRRAMWHAVRGPDGRPKQQADYERVLDAFAEYVSRPEGPPARRRSGDGLQAEPRPSADGGPDA